MSEREFLGRTKLYMEIIDQLSHRELIEFSRQICLLHDQMDILIIGHFCTGFRMHMSEIFAFLILHGDKRVKCYTQAAFENSWDHKPEHFPRKQFHLVLTMKDPKPRSAQIDDIVFRTYDFPNCSTADFREFLARYSEKNVGQRTHG